MNYLINSNTCFKFGVLSSLSLLLSYFKLIFIPGFSILNLYFFFFSPQASETLSKHIVASYFFLLLFWLIIYRSYVARYRYMDLFFFLNLSTVDFTFLFYCCALFCLLLIQLSIANRYQEKLTCLWWRPCQSKPVKNLDIRKSSISNISFHRKQSPMLIMFYILHSNYDYSYSLDLPHKCL